MNNYLDDAVEELKRADHLIYVSLKYTRTVDVLRSIIERLINAFDFGIDLLLENFKKKRGKGKRNQEYPIQPLSKCKFIKKKYNKEELTNYINLYLLLRKLSRVEKFTKKREFRRHVTMTAFLDDGSVIEVTMDVVKEYFNKTKDFINYIEGL